MEETEAIYMEESRMLRIVVPSNQFEEITLEIMKDTNLCIAKKKEIASSS